MPSRLPRLALAAAALALCGSAARAAEPAQHCIHTDIVLWGDGRHDDTTALNDWLQGKDIVWAESGDPVGDTISGHSFRLSAAVYVSAGSGRVLRDFTFVWPERNETVSGASIVSGDDADKAPVSTGVQISGGDAGEGVPFDDPAVTPTKPNPRASCATS
ncbi:MAG: hypothetical protein JO001_09705 [Alphaproteobacteria bacterium]|nr:hypothetical protein [Alphaproteobacteria bacterium]